MTILRRSLLLGVLVGLAGCVPTTRTYDVRVSNRTDGPVTLWLTKNGPPAERGWEPPEALATKRLRDDDLRTGVILERNMTVSTRTLTGKFYRDTGAVLRVYSGELKFADILAIGRSSPSRYDYKLDPGHNDVIIVDAPTGVRASRRPTSPPTR